jgi:hypothetical protein
MILLTLALACSNDPDLEDPSIEIIHPTVDDSLAVGPFSVTVAVENFALRDPAKDDYSAPEGFIAASMDGVEVLTTAETTFSGSTDAMGTYTLGVELRDTDGDPLDPPAEDEVTLAIE